ncbi:hypothetical protein [Streptomyces sp. NPDC002644]
MTDFCPLDYCDPDFCGFAKGLPCEWSKTTAQPLEPQIGDFGLTRIEGFVGRLVNFGQWMVGDHAPVQHALVYVGDGLVVQAMPGGAECIPLEDASPVVKWSTGIVDLTENQRWDIASWATVFVGTPYGWLDYLALGLERFGFRWNWLRRYIMSNHSMICSQLVDYVYAKAGVDLFTDGRLPGDITPGDLYHLLMDKESND